MKKFNAITLGSIPAVCTSNQKQRKLREIDTQIDRERERGRNTREERETSEKETETEG